jgi:hypothetical protein
MTGKELGEELLEAVRQMKAGRVTVVREKSSSGARNTPAASQ